MALFGPKKKLQDLEVSLVTSKTIYDTYDQLPQQVQGSALNGLHAKLAKAYQGAVSAGAIQEAQALLQKYLDSPPTRTPAGLIGWADLLEAVRKSAT